MEGIINRWYEFYAGVLVGDNTTRRENNDEHSQPKWDLTE